MQEKQFVDGLMIKKPNPNAPEWIKVNASIKREDMLRWLGEQSGDWINIQICEGKSGKWYAEVDNWKPQSQGGQ